jgi:DNA-binding CsgD family transcriptional regulator
MEILILTTARGLSNCRIATELHLAEATVKRHMANKFQKMAVHSRSEAVRMALMEQWIGLHEITCPANTNGSSDGSFGANRTSIQRSAWKVTAC